MSSPGDTLSDKTISQYYQLYALMETTDCFCNVWNHIFYETSRSKRDNTHAVLTFVFALRNSESARKIWKDQSRVVQITLYHFSAVIPKISLNFSSPLFHFMPSFLKVQ